MGGHAAASADDTGTPERASANRAGLRPRKPTHRRGKGRSAKRTRPKPICRLASGADASETALSARSERLGRSHAHVREERSTRGSERALDTARHGRWMDAGVPERGCHQPVRYVRRRSAVAAGLPSNASASAFQRSVSSGQRTATVPRMIVSAIGPVFGNGDAFSETPRQPSAKSW